MGLRAFNRERYGRLCAEAGPMVIKTDEELRRLAARMEDLDFKENPTPEDEALSELLAKLIEDYEARVELPPVEPYRIVLHLMAQNSLSRADLMPIFGSRSVASDVLNGKRELSKAHIRGLAAFFHVSPAAFF